MPYNIFFGKFFLLTPFCFYLFFLPFLSFFFVFIFSPIYSPPIIQSNPILLSSSFSSFFPLFTRAQVTSHNSTTRFSLSHLPPSLFFLPSVFHTCVKLVKSSGQNEVVYQKSRKKKKMFLCSDVCVEDVCAIYSRPCKASENLT